MHPAYSVIMFTVSSGAGYGLLIWLALTGAMGLAPVSSLGVASGFILSSFALALALITFGLLASTAHLGHPERAWRALSQWRSSWLSREGVFACVTYLPTLWLAWQWGVQGHTSGGIFMALCLVATGLAIATLISTGMIYACLRTVRVWNRPITVVTYIVLALASGSILFGGLSAIFGAFDFYELRHFAGMSMLSLCAAGLCKMLYWHKIDDLGVGYTSEQAFGLKGNIREIEPAHTLPNYVMREMGYRVARTHRLRLRKIALALIWGLPTALMLGVILWGGSFFTAAYVALYVLAAFALIVGLLIERWLFFAEAVHVVTLYYGDNKT